MNHKFRLACMILAAAIIVAAIVMMSLQLTATAAKGPKGNDGQEGLPEPILIDTLFTFDSPTPDGTFASPPSIPAAWNGRNQIVSSGFILTALQAASLNPGDLIPILSLPSTLFPKFAAGTLGTVFPLLSSSQPHVLMFDRSATTNVSFLATDVLEIVANDQFTVNMTYIL